MIGELITLGDVERILATITGGLALWCGYRLFRAVPGHPANAEAVYTLAEIRRFDAAVRSESGSARDAGTDRVPAIQGSPGGPEGALACDTSDY